MAELRPISAQHRAELGPSCIVCSERGGGRSRRPPTHVGGVERRESRGKLAYFDAPRHHPPVAVPPLTQIWAPQRPALLGTPRIDAAPSHYASCAAPHPDPVSQVAPTPPFVAQNLARIGATYKRLSGLCGRAENAMDGVLDISRRSGQPPSVGPPVESTLAPGHAQGLHRPSLPLMGGRPKPGRPRPHRARI